MRHGNRIERNTLLAAQHLENIPGWDAPERVESVLGQMEPMPRRNHLPRAPMQGHRVGKGAVTIEDKAPGKASGFRGHGSVRDE